MVNCNHVFQDCGYVLIAPQICTTNPNSTLQTEVCTKCGLLKATSKEIDRLKDWEGKDSP